MVTVIYRVLGAATCGAWHVEIRLDDLSRACDSTFAMENSANATCRALLAQTELTFVTDNLVFAVQQGDPGSFDALIAHMGDLGIYSTEARGICARILCDPNSEF